MQQVRKKPRAANVRVMNTLLYGPEYDDTTDEQIDEALNAAGVEGPPVAKTKHMSYSECILAVRHGELRDGTPLQGRLVGYSARAYVISLGGAEVAAMECARAFGGLYMLVNEHITSVGLHAVGERVAA